MNSHGNYLKNKNFKKTHSKFAINKSFFEDKYSRNNFNLALWRIHIDFETDIQIAKFTF